MNVQNKNFNNFNIILGFICLTSSSLLIEGVHSDSASKAMALHRYSRSRIPNVPAPARERYLSTLINKFKNRSHIEGMLKALSKKHKQYTRKRKNNDFRTTESIDLKKYATMISVISWYNFKYGCTYWLPDATSNTKNPKHDLRIGGGADRRKRPGTGGPEGEGHPENVISGHNTTTKKVYNFTSKKRRSTNATNNTEYPKHGLKTEKSAGIRHMPVSGGPEGGGDPGNIFGSHKTKKEKVYTLISKKRRNTNATNNTKYSKHAALRKSSSEENIFDKIANFGMEVLDWLGIWKSTRRSIWPGYGGPGHGPDPSFLFQSPFWKFKRTKRPTTKKPTKSGAFNTTSNITSTTEIETKPLMETLPVTILTDVMYKEYGNVIIIQSKQTWPQIFYPPYMNFFGDEYLTEANSEEYKDNKGNKDDKEDEAGSEEGGSKKETLDINYVHKWDLTVRQFVLITMDILIYKEDAYDRVLFLEAEKTAIQLQELGKLEDFGHPFQDGWMFLFAMLNSVPIANIRADLYNGKRRLNRYAKRYREINDILWKIHSLYRWDDVERMYNILHRINKFHSVRRTAAKKLCKDTFQELIVDPFERNRGTEGRKQLISMLNKYIVNNHFPKVISWYRNDKIVRMVRNNEQIQGITPYNESVVITKNKKGSTTARIMHGSRVDVMQQSDRTKNRSDVWSKKFDYSDGKREKKKISGLTPYPDTATFDKITLKHQYNTKRITEKGHWEKTSDIMSLMGKGKIYKRGRKQSRVKITDQDYYRKNTFRYLTNTFLSYDSTRFINGKYTGRSTLYYGNSDYYRNKAQEFLTQRYTVRKGGEANRDKNIKNHYKNYYRKIVSKYNLGLKRNTGIKKDRKVNSEQSIQSENSDTDSDYYRKIASEYLILLHTEQYIKEYKLKGNNFGTTFEKYNYVFGNNPTKVDQESVGACRGVCDPPSYGNKRAFNG